MLDSLVTTRVLNYPVQEVKKSHHITLNDPGSVGLVTSGESRVKIDDIVFYENELNQTYLRSASSIYFMLGYAILFSYHCTFSKMICAIIGVSVVSTQSDFVLSFHTERLYNVLLARDKMNMISTQTHSTRPIEGTWELVSPRATVTILRIWLYCTVLTSHFPLTKYLTWQPRRHSWEARRQNKDSS